MIRNKFVTLTRTDVDEAAFTMDVMDYHFHLFTESGTGQDSVLYRAGSTGYRLLQLQPNPDALADHVLPITISEHPAPRRNIGEAIAKIIDSGRPFSFFGDHERGRGALLYQRYDGHFGLITPGRPSV